MLGKEFIRNHILNYKWKKMHKGTNTTIVNCPDLNCISVGRDTYGPLDVRNDNTGSRLIIGDYCSIGDQVTFLLGYDHNLEHFSTFPFKRVSLAGDFEAESKGDIVLADDVWVGFGSIIMSGVHIGQGAVIAAGAVVTGDVPAYSIVGGVPARLIRKRFSDEVIEELLKTDYKVIDHDFIMQNISKMYSKIESADQLDWLPKVEKSI